MTERSSVPAGKEAGLDIYNLALSLYREAKYVEAAEKFELALLPLEKSYPEKYGIALRMLAICLSRLKNYKRAAFFGSRSVEVFNKLDSKENLIKACHTVSITLSKTGKIIENYELIKTALGLFPAVVNKNMKRYYDFFRMGEGIALTAMERYGEAEKVLVLALECCFDPEICFYIKEKLAEVYRKTGEGQKAKDLLDEIIKEKGNERARPYYLRAKLHHSEMRVVSDFNTAIDIVDEEASAIGHDDFKNVFIEETKKEIYDTAISYFLENKCYDDAFQTIQKIKARTLADKLSKTPEERNNLSGFFNLKTKSMPLKQVEGLLEKGTACLEMFMHKDSIVLFLIKHNSHRVQVIELNREDLKKDITNIIEIIGLKRDRPLKYNLDKLYDKIFAGILAEEKYLEKLILIPHQEIHDISFAIFKKKYDLCYLPSVQLLKTFRVRHESSLDSCLILADSKQDLSGAGIEAENIAKKYKINNFFKGEEATIENFRRNYRDFSILHIACHTVFKPGSPLESCIFLKTNKGDEYKLTLKEIMKMDMNNLKLVVLSSCESGKGKLTGISDEMVCFTRAFLTAGAKGVLVTFGVVDDEITTELMEEFYTNLKKGETVARSLKLAQQKVRKTHPSPYYWAGFQYVGL